MDQLVGFLSGGSQLDGELNLPKVLGDLGTKTITENGTYDASDDGYDGYSQVTANVPNTYTAGDEGKVVDNGALVSQTSATYTLNNTYDTTLINSVTVNVSGGSTPTLETVTKTYTPTTSQQTETITPSTGYDGIGEVDVTVNAMPTGTEGTPSATKGAVSNHSVAVTPSVTNQAGYIAGGTKTGTAVTVSASELDSGTKSITSNGSNQDVVGYAAVDVAVPNSYSAADEGKVVSSGALVAQIAHADVTPTTSDQTIDTTTNNSIKVKGDADLVAGNIKKDVEIFGVTGSYEGGGGGTAITSEGITPVAEGASYYPGTGYNGLIVVAKKPTLVNDWDFTESLEDSIGGLTATLGNGAAQSSSGVAITGATHNISLPIRLTLNHTYEVDIASISKVFTSGHGRILMFDDSAGFIAQNGTNLKFYSNSVSSWDNVKTGGTDISVLAGKTLRFALSRELSGQSYNASPSSYGQMTFWIDGNIYFRSILPQASITNKYIRIGYTANSYYNMVITGFRHYEGTTY